MGPAGDKVRVAAVGDLLRSKLSQWALQSVFGQIAEGADVLALCGDRTDHGLSMEHVLAGEANAPIKIPIVVVLGNHDSESDKPGELQQIQGDAGVTVLDGESCENKDVGGPGIKGFLGVFGRCALRYGERRLPKERVRSRDRSLIHARLLLSRD